MQKLALRCDPLMRGLPYKSVWHVKAAARGPARALPRYAARPE